MKAVKGTQSPTFGMICEKLDPRDRVHMAQLADLDAESSPNHWDAAKYRQEISRPHVSCHGVTLGDGTLVAYAIVRESGVAVAITDMMVGSNYRRKGVGRMLVDCVRKSHVEGPRESIEVVVDDVNLDAHLFLKHIGFRGEVLREDGRYFYLFRWTNGKGHS